MFLSDSGFRSKAIDQSTEEYFCHLNRKQFALVIRIFSDMDMIAQKNPKTKNDFNSPTTSVKLCFKKILGRIIFGVDQQK